jgi:hypothetical protein
MKELQPKAKLAKQEIVAPQEKQFEQVYQGSLKPHQGHTLFEINTKTGEIAKAEFKQEAIKWEDAVNLGIRSLSRKCIVKPDYVYISALNEKNALKKFNTNKV